MQFLLRFFLSIFMLLFTWQVALAEDHTLKLDGIDGKQHALNEYIGHGKWVVVNVWATACPYCRHELFDLINFHEAHHGKDAIVIGLTIEWPSFELPNRKYVTEFASDYFIDYPLLLVNADIANRVIGKPVDMVPISFFYNPKGQLVHRISGMVTEEMLEKVIQQNHSSYSTEWAEEMPPEYRPKSE